MAPPSPPASDEDGGPEGSASPQPSQHPTWQAVTQMNPPVLRLPNEMLLEIFEHVAAFYENKPNPHKLGCSSSPTWNHQFPNDSEGPAWSIMAVRLTCCRFCAVSSHLLIRSLQVDMTDSSLDRLNKIASHPVFSKSVRAVRVSIHEHLPPMDDDDLEDDPRWYRWLQYHLTELNLCVPISVGVTSSFPSMSSHKLKRCVADKSHVADVTQIQPGITQVADVAFIMLDAWDRWDLGWCFLVGIPDQDLRLFFQDLKDRILEQCQQQRKWLKNLAELASTIAAALQRMPRANMFEVGEYNPDMFDVGDYNPDKLLEGLKGSRIVFSVFKAFLTLLKHHGSLCVLELVRLLLLFGNDWEKSWADALDFLRNTRPCNGPISIWHPAGEFEDGENKTINYAFVHSVPGADGTPGVRSPAEVYAMGGTDENPMRSSRFRPGFVEPESDTE
ncbi:hypothetical protein B0T18DRAFT_450577 [Schizothecium vesticola]|uniref:F-box domain-containing protein n=1 Tax=Schizothecium vesticola TaxID=314040 RepID=A0AA40BQQ9_9PEZI|nr:hypothetical protein B0T18DRAFT_450577 [Schizothecium vesticola]